MRLPLHHSNSSLIIFSHLQVSNTNQMLAALAGGSLPFILRMVMEPEKPDIEIGTVSFKSQLDEVIKNFVQMWPIYDLPFELYTAEDEEHDRKLAEEKKQKEEGRGGGDGGTLERRKNLDGSRSGSLDRGQAADQLRHPLLFSSHVTANNNAENCVDGEGATGVSGGNHVVIMRQPQTYVEERPAEVAETAKAKVGFSGVLNDEPAPKPEVDIVIYLPLKFEGAWLDQLSDIDDNAVGSSSDDDDAEVFKLNDTRQQQWDSNVTTTTTTTAMGVDAEAFSVPTTGTNRTLIRQ